MSYAVASASTSVLTLYMNADLANFTDAMLLITKHMDAATHAADKEEVGGRGHIMGFTARQACALTVPTPMTALRQAQPFVEGAFKAAQKVQGSRCSSVSWGSNWRRSKQEALDPCFDDKQASVQVGLEGSSAPPPSLLSGQAKDNQLQEDNQLQGCASVSSSSGAEAFQFVAAVCNTANSNYDSGGEEPLHDDTQLTSCKANPAHTPSNPISSHPVRSSPTPPPIPPPIPSHPPSQPSSRSSRDRVRVKRRQHIKGGVSVCVACARDSLAASPPVDDIALGHKLSQMATWMTHTRAQQRRPASCQDYHRPEQAPHFVAGGHHEMPRQRPGLYPLGSNLGGSTEIGEITKALEEAVTVEGGMLSLLRLDPSMFYFHGQHVRSMLEYRFNHLRV